MPNCFAKITDEITLVKIIRSNVTGIDNSVNIKMLSQGLSSIYNIS